MAGEGAPFTLPRPGWRAALALVLAVVVIGVLIAARLGGGDTDTPSGRTEPTVSVSAAGPTGSSIPLPDDGVAGPAEKPYDKAAVPPALAAATAFVRAWANHPAGITPEAWWAAVTRHTDAVLARQLKATDPQRVPATKVTGAATTISGGSTSAVIGVPTDAGRVVLTCVLLDGRWLVSDLDIERVSP